MDRDESVRCLIGHALNDHHLDDFAQNRSIGNRILGDLKECGFLADERAALTSPAPAGGEVLPADVVELVIAARIVAFEDQSPEALRDLDKASEAFAERVPWDNDPEQFASELVQELHELPENLRIPLRSLQTDTRLLFGQVASDGSVAGIMADSVLERLSQIETAALALANPPPSPDVAGVVERLRRAAAVWSSDGVSDDALGVIKTVEQAATLLESLSAEKGRLVDLVKDLDDALCAAQEKLQGNPLVLKWVIEIIGDARDRARTALTPKEKA